MCRPPLWPGLRVTYHYASKWSGLAVTYPTPSTDSGCGPGVHSRSSFVHIVLQRPSLCTEEVRSHGLYVGDTKLLLALHQFDIRVAISDFNGDLREIAKWRSTNSLLINPNKTKLLVVSVPQLTRNVSLPPVVLLGKNIKLFPVQRLGGLDRLCRNFRRSYI